jgi:putative transposase
MAARRIERTLACRPNEIWAMYFVSDALFNGNRFRALTVVDAFTRECLAMHAGQGIKGEAVAAVIESLTFQRETNGTHQDQGRRWPGVYLPSA